MQISVEEIAGHLGQGETVGRCCLKPVAERVERTRKTLADIFQARWCDSEGAGPELAEMSRADRVALAVELVRSLEDEAE